MSSDTTYNYVYNRLLERYGPQNWWPANDPFEIAVGAVLTQGTAWINAARAIESLRLRRLLHPGVIHTLPASKLAEGIRSAGFHNVKADRLKAMSAWWLAAGGYRGLKAMPTGELRDSLLRVHGIGRETADAIVLYAFERRVFVVDAYARRIFSRIGLLGGDERYETLRRDAEEGFEGATQGCNEYHALIVEHAKRQCRATPLCETCCLSDVCAYAASTDLIKNGAISRYGRS